MDFTISCDILCELLEVSINLILYTRDIYPAAAFKRRKKYNIPVQLCVFPELRDYISKCVASIRPHLEKGEVQQVIVAILGPDSNLVERFVFDLKQEPLRPYQVKEDKGLQRLEEALRAFCLKLSIADSLLRPLPPNCSFCVQMRLPEDTNKDTEQDFPWVEPEKEQVELPNSHIVPLKSLKSELCKMQLYVEEGRKADT